MVEQLTVADNSVVYHSLDVAHTVNVDSNNTFRFQQDNLLLTVRWLLSRKSRMELRCLTGQVTKYSNIMRLWTQHLKRQDKELQTHTVGEQIERVDVMKCKDVTTIYQWVVAELVQTHVLM